MPYKAIDIANHILSLLRSQDIKIDNMRLQKMLCMLEYDYLDRYGKDLFNDRIEVWHYGPVVPTVYYAYHTFVASNITTFKGSDTVTDDDRPFLDTLIARYGMMNLSLLIEESKHGADAHPFRNSPSPWTENTTT